MILLPNWVFINNEVFDKKLMENISTVKFNVQGLTHNVFYKAIKITRDSNMTIGYIGMQNEKLAMQEIERILQKQKSIE